jgi:DNA-binding protein HU-beta
MTFTEFTREWARRTGYTPVELQKINREFVNLLVEILADGHSLRVYKLGIFSNEPDKPKPVRNPITGEWRMTPPRRKLKFRPIETVRDKVRWSNVNKPETFGLEEEHGEVRSKDRSAKSRKGKAGREGQHTQPQHQRPGRSGTRNRTL